MIGKPLEMWVVYKHPKDFPGMYVARLHHVRPREIIATDSHHVADTLDGVRDALPPGLVCLDRDPHDDPVIVETWL